MNADLLICVNMCLYVFLFVNKSVDISMVVICYASDFTEYDRNTRASCKSNV